MQMETIANVVWHRVLFTLRIMTPSPSSLWEASDPPPVCTTGLWLRANETEISAGPRALWLGKN